MDGLYNLDATARQQSLVDCREISRFHYSRLAVETSYFSSLHYSYWYQDTGDSITCALGSCVWVL